MRCDVDRVLLVYYRLDVFYVCVFSWVRVAGYLADFGVRTVEWMKLTDSFI